jgi:Overcoming lysogenization defect protein-like, TOPRIM domain
VDTVVLVEGISDRLALETLASRRGIDVSIVDMGGAHAIRRFLERYADTRVVGLCDERERNVFARAGVERFEVCVADLEDELIRALGPERVEEALEAHDRNALRTFRKQPQWRGRPLHDQLRRFLCSSDRRKLRYVPVLTSLAEDEGVVPPPLAAALEAASNAATAER